MTNSSNFKWTGSSRELTSSVSQTTQFVNLKNKADGARRYGFRCEVYKHTDVDGLTFFRAVFNTTLTAGNVCRDYQSAKYGEMVATEQEALDGLAKTVKGALKRYAKLATNPASKIEVR